MSLLHCLLDTSALVKKYNPREFGADVVAYLFRHPRLMTMHFVDVCIPEVRHTFFKGAKLSFFQPSERTAMLTSFKIDLEAQRMFIHHVTDTNIISTQSIIPKAWRGVEVRMVNGQKEAKPKVGSIDCLILSSAMQMKNLFENFYLVTADKKMADMARLLSIPRMLLQAWNVGQIRKQLQHIRRRRGGRRRSNS